MMIMIISFIYEDNVNDDDDNDEVDDDVYLCRTLPAFRACIGVWDSAGVFVC
jgi:hypothetical protein